MTSRVAKSRPDSAAETHRYGFVYNPSASVERVDEDPAAGASSLISDADLADFDFVGAGNNKQQQHHHSRERMDVDNNNNNNNHHQSPDIVFNPLYAESYPPAFGQQSCYSAPNNGNYSRFPDWTVRNNIKDTNLLATQQSAQSQSQPKRPDEYGFYSASLPSLSTSDSSGGPAVCESGSFPSCSGLKPTRTTTKQHMDFDDQQQQVLERRRRRRESHNAVERRRRDNINGKIQELSSLLPESFFYDTHSTAYIAHSRTQQQLSPESESPPTAVFGYDMEPSHTTISGLTKDGKPNKGAILQKSVEYIRHLEDCLRQERERAMSLEEELNRGPYAARQSQDWPHVKAEPQEGSQPRDNIGYDDHHHDAIPAEFQHHPQRQDPNRMNLSSFEDYSSSTGHM